MTPFLDHKLADVRDLPDAMAREMRAAGTKKNFTTKNDLLKLSGMTEAIFRNIAIICFCADNMWLITNPASTATT